MHDYTVIWSGSSKAPIPGIGAIVRRQDYLSAAADVDGAALTKAERTRFAGPPLNWRTSRQAKMAADRRCTSCGSRKVGTQNWQAGIRECWTCRNDRMRVEKGGERGPREIGGV